jgi:hypothetical protein
MSEHVPVVSQGRARASRVLNRLQIYRPFRCPLAAALLLLAAHGAAAAPLAVEIENASTPTLCAESDNVYVKLISAKVQRFTIEATHPAYSGTIVADNSAADFRHCDIASDPVHPVEARRVTLYETTELQLVGRTYPSFWRPADVPVRVGARSERGLHLLQLFVRFGERSEEVLVLYPADGYWRARPLPPQHLQGSAYGSSFMIGPIESGDRPYVDISAVTFDPATQSFTLAFTRGGSATLRLVVVDRDHITLEAKLAPAVAAPRPFAALRSMFVSETNADVARVAWIAPGAKGFANAAIMDLQKQTALELWAGRRLPSRHNTSAPDLTFGDFQGAD